jgi:hypothetical protein
MQNGETAKTNRYAGRVPRDWVVDQCQVSGESRSGVVGFRVLGQIKDKHLGFNYPDSNSVQVSLHGEQADTRAVSISGRQEL